MWIAHHWRLIGLCLLIWVAVSFPLTIIVGRYLRLMGDD
jgi:putative solute:sodium symporter small subunit